MSNTEPLSGGIKILFIIIAVFFAPVGLVLGIIYLNNPLEENKKLGKLVLIISIVMLVLWCLCVFVLPAILALMGVALEGFLGGMLPVTP